MANKRMFAQTIIDSDVFLDMPLSTQALYFHLSMRADDDGFVNNPKKISRMIGCGEDDLRLLIAKKFILIFESGVVVIKHWLIHNTIRKDRKTPTSYQKELGELTQQDNGAYTKDVDTPTLDRVDVTPVNQVSTKWQPDDNQVATKWQPDDNQVATKCQHSVVDYSVLESSVVETIITDDDNSDKKIKNVFVFYEQNIGMASSYIQEELIHWIKDLDDEVVLEAIKVSVDMNIKNYSYINGVLKNWVSRGVKSISDVRALQVEHENKKKQSNGSRRHNTYQEPIPEAMKQKHEPQEEVTLESEEELKARLKELIGD